MKKLFILFTLVVMELPWVSNAQTSSLISGSVTYMDSKQPIAGVSIQLLNTNIGGITDLKGLYSIRVPNSKKDTLRFSYIGCFNKKISINHRHQINVQMENNPATQKPIIVLTCCCAVPQAKAKADSAFQTNKGEKRH